MARSTSTAGETGAAKRRAFLFWNGTGRIAPNVHLAGTVVVVRTCVRWWTVVVKVSVWVLVTVERLDRVVRICVAVPPARVIVDCGLITKSVAVVVLVENESVTV
jgi:hypothetical protein